MADAADTSDAGGLDISKILAPWMQQSPWDMSGYGGAGQFGAAMLAGAGPTPYRQPFLVGLGKAMQSGQINALQNAQQRMGLAGNSLMLQRQMAMWPMMSAIMNRMAGGTSVAQGAPPAQTNGDSQDAAPASDAAQSTAGNGAAPAPSQAPWMGGQQGGMNPFEESQLGALASMAGLPGGTEAQKDAALRLQYDPAMAAQQEYAKSTMYQDQLGKAFALRAGRPDIAQMYDNKLRQDSGALQVARNSGIRQELLPNGQWSMYNPEQMTQGVGNSIEPIPGALQTKGALAAAASIGKAAGEPIELTDDAQGSHTGTPFAKYPAPLSSVVGGSPTAGRPQRGAAPSSPGTPAPTSPVSELGPQQETFLKGRGTQSADYLTELHKAAESARDTNYSLDQLIAASQGATLGPGAPTREWFEKRLTTLGNLFGVAAPGASELGSYTEMGKYSNKIGFAAARQMGSREAAQIVSMSIESNPNKNMVPAAFNDVAQSMKAMNNYIIDKNVVMQESGKDAQSASAKWVQQVDPRVWGLTLSPEMASKWAPIIGKEKIEAAYGYMQPAERAALLRNIPADLRKQWLAQ